MAVTNGWGQGVLNNLIEWGKGAINNTNSWGAIYADSYSGDTALTALTANLLLDQYSGAAAAYSVRKLSSSYSGSALRVRRSSDNAEQDIGFSGNDLDTSALTTFVGANDGFVVTWYDQSGNSNNFTNALAAGQPQIVSSGTVLTSGSRPAIKWNGTSDSLGNNVAALKVSRLDSYFVHEVGAAEDYYIYPSRTGGGSVQFGFVAREANTSTLIYSDYGTPSLYANGSAANTTNRGTIFTELDGRKIVVHEAANTSAFAEGYSLGNYANAVYFNGFFAEVVLYASDQSANRTAIESNINTYYNIYWDGTVSDPDAQAYLDEVVAQGGSLTNEVADEYNAFVLREKAASRYSKIKRLYPFLGGVIDSARVDAVTLAQATNNNFVDADADATCGLQGDGSTKYLMEALPSYIWASINDTQGFHFQDGSSGALEYMFCSFNSSSNLFIGLLETAFDTRYASGSPSIAADSNNLITNSASGGRFSSTDVRVWVDGANVNQKTTANAVTTFPSLALPIFARNLNGTIDAFNSRKGFGTMMAEGMTPTELLACESSYKTFLTNIGAI